MTTRDHDADAPPVRESAPARSEATGNEELSVLLLAAAGLALGVALALAVRPPAPRRRLVREAHRVRGDVDRAMRAGAREGRRTVEEVRDTVAGYVDAAREAIADTAADELRALRKAMRRRRRHLGL